MPLTAIEHRTLAELSANAGRVLTYEHLLRQVWRLEGDADLHTMRTLISSLRRKLGDGAEDPTYIFTQLRVGYRMPEGETHREEGCASGWTHALEMSGGRTNAPCIHRKACANQSNMQRPISLAPKSPLM